MTSSVRYKHGCNFSKSIRCGGGGQQAKSAHGNIKVPIESDFSSYLTPFLPNIGGVGGGGSAHRHWGMLSPTSEGLGPPKEI